MHGSPVSHRAFRSESPDSCMGHQCPIGRQSQWFFTRGCLHSSLCYVDYKYERFDDDLTAVETMRPLLGGGGMSLGPLAIGGGIHLYK